MCYRVELICRSDVILDLTITWVQAPLWVQLCVPVDLSTTNQDGLDPHQLCDREWQGEAGVLGAVKLYLTSLSPGG